MTRALACLTLFLGTAALPTLAAPEPRGQDKKAKPKEIKKKAAGPVVDGTDKAGQWGYWQAKTGLKILTDRDYVLSVLPKEMVGGTFIGRPSGESVRWLPDGALTAHVDVTAYAIVRVKSMGNETFDATAQRQLVKEGWAEVDGKVGTSFPTGEGWEWKAYKRNVPAGDVYLPLKDLKWDEKTGVLFLFTERKKPKP